MAMQMTVWTEHINYLGFRFDGIYGVLESLHVYYILEQMLACCSQYRFDNEIH
jgi:hypothetical protein